jgi:hypothetical protein
VGKSSIPNIINNGNKKREYRSACGEGPLIKRQRLFSSNGNSLKPSRNIERLNELQLQDILHRAILLTEGWPCYQMESLRASLEWILEGQKIDIYESINECLARFEHNSSGYLKNEFKLEST